MSSPRPSTTSNLASASSRDGTGYYLAKLTCIYNYALYTLYSARDASSDPPLPALARRLYSALLASAIC